MKSKFTFLMALTLSATAYAQGMSTVAQSQASPGAPVSQGLPMMPTGTAATTNSPASLPTTAAPADGAITTPGQIAGPNSVATPGTVVPGNNTDNLTIRQSGQARPLNQQELNFRNNLQGTQPQAIPSQGIGIPDPMNPNPNTPPTTPIPPTGR